MLKRLTLIFSLVFSALSVQHLQAQEKKSADIDTVKVHFFNGIAVHADLIGAAQMVSSDHGQWEAGLRINIKDKYFPAFEIGIGDADESDEYDQDLWCKTRAPYFRIGCDYNILRNKHDIYKAFVGLRYGFSKFNYDTQVKTVTETDSDDTAETDESTSTTVYTEYDKLDATCHWLEVVFGVDAKIWVLHLGWDVRYRRMLSNKHSDIAEPWYIPGFGNKKAAGFAALFNFTLAL